MAAPIGVETLNRASQTRHRLTAAAIYVAVLSAASLPLLYDFPVPDEALSITLAEFAAHDGSSPPADWGAAVALPDDWRRRHVAGREGWYRATLFLDAPVEVPWAVVIPTVRLNAALYVNGLWVGNGGRFADPVARNLRNPLIFNVPNDVLRAGNNELVVRTKAGPDGYGFLSPLHLGPEASLHAAFRLHHLLRVSTVQLITLVLTLIGGAIGVLAFLRMADAEYRYFSLGVLIWALHSLSYFTVHIPVSDRLWDWFTFATLGYFAVIGGVVYVHRYLGLKHLRAEAAAVSAVVAGSLLLAALPDDYFYPVAYKLWHPLCQTIGLYGLARILLAAWRRHNLELHVIAASGIVLCGYAMHDLSLALAIGDWQNGYVIHYAMLFILGLFCAVLLQRFVRSLNEADALNRDLERRVEKARRDLEDQYARLQLLEKERVLADERNRLMRDMHDGIGGQLVSTLALIERGTAPIAHVERLLKAALQDLRLMIDSMDVGGEDMAAMLGMFRSRIEPSLTAQNIRLRWDIGDVEDVPEFGAGKALHVLRILQEAVTNVLRHSGASALTISAHDLRGGGACRLLIEVTDNGNGINDDHTPGRGLANMRQRAKAIGADLTVASTPDGTTVALYYDRRAVAR